MTDPILHGFERRLRRPREAMVRSPDRTASVGDVHAMAQALTARLRDQGIESGSIVALAAPNGPAFVAGLLAVRRHRCAALLFDRHTPLAERARTGRTLGVSATIECRRGWPRSSQDLTVSPPSQPAPRSVSPEIAVVKLTSGSTGCPRGILTSSSALAADDAALAETMELRPDDRIFTAIPMSHSYGLSSAVMPALMRRSVLVVPPECGGPVDPVLSARNLEVTFFPTVPAVLQALVKMAKPPRLPRSLHRVISAGAPLEPWIASRFRQVYDRPVHVFYGASECGGISFDRTGTAGERGTVGTPVEGVRLTLDPVAGVADAGTVTIESPAVAVGYCPEDDGRLGDGRFRSHDLASLQNGELVLQGRLDDLINVRGRKINPREVERVLGDLEGIEDVAVLGVTPPGRSEAVVRSFIVCRSDTVTREAVRAWCRRHLAHYKVPRSIVWLDEIPRNERGKLDRRALLACAPSLEAPTPQPTKSTRHG